MTTDLNIKNINGPILILGAGGFIGSQLFKKICEIRKDCFGTIRRTKNWRLDNLHNIYEVDLEHPEAFKSLMQKIQPKTIFNLACYGNRSFHKDQAKIISTNFLLPHLILSYIEKNEHITYINTGSSSEYGLNCDFAREDFLPNPNSIYSVSKISTANLVHYYGKVKNIACVNLRLFSVYGPYEDHDRLIPSLILHGLSNIRPKIGTCKTSRDFVFIDDVVNSIITCCSNLKKEHWGKSFNICTGKKTTIDEIFDSLGYFFPHNKKPITDDSFDFSWNVENWYGNPDQTEKVFGLKPKTSLCEGIEKTILWYKNFLKHHNFSAKAIINNPNPEVNYQKKISIIVACYNDGPSIPELAKRVHTTMEKINCKYEIIFIENQSTDNTHQILQDLSTNNPHIIGVLHSSQSSSQASFKSGMEMASGDACVLMDGDLQDPPEIIEFFYNKWIKGNDIVFGKRSSREGPLLITLGQKLFYRFLNLLSYHSIPNDAGDFSLMDKKVVKVLLMYQDKKPFWRTSRAKVGFIQDFVEYHRPERKHGSSTNNLFKYFGWAIYGLMSSENKIIFYFPFILFLTSFAILFYIKLPILLSLIIATLATITFFVPCMYLNQILEETRNRPLFTRSKIIRNGRLNDC